MTEGRDARAAARRWSRAGAALEAVRRSELRALTDDEGLAAAEAVLDLVRVLPVEERGTGLVEQQRLFSRLRRP